MRRKDREVTDIEKIEEILDACKVSRIGLMDQGKIYIVPMNHGYSLEDGRLVLYYHGANEGKKLELVKENPQVGFEMDCGHELVEGRLACQHSYHYASIIGNGEARVITEPEEKLKALAVIMKHQTGKEFQEFETNPRLEKAVSIIKVELKPSKKPLNSWSKRLQEVKNEKMDCYAYQLAALGRCLSDFLVSRGKSRDTSKKCAEFKDWTNLSNK